MGAATVLDLAAEGDRLGEVGELGGLLDAGVGEAVDQLVLDPDGEGGLGHLDLRRHRAGHRSGNPRPNPSPHPRPSRRASAGVHRGVAHAAPQVVRVDELGDLGVRRASHQQAEPEPAEQALGGGAPGFLAADDVDELADERQVGLDQVGAVDDPAPQLERPDRDVRATGGERRQVAAPGGQGAACLAVGGDGRVQGRAQRGLVAVGRAGRLLCEEHREVVRGRRCAHAEQVAPRRGAVGLLDRAGALRRERGAPDLEPVRGVAAPLVAARFELLDLCGQLPVLRRRRAVQGALLGALRVLLLGAGGQKVLVQAQDEDLERGHRCVGLDQSAQLDA